MDAFPDIRTLIPHAGPSCLLHSVLRSGPEGTECQALLGHDHPYAEQGAAHSLLAIELFAQAAAVHRRLSLSEPGEPVIDGVLAAANVVLEEPRIKVDSWLLVRVVQDTALGRLLRFSGELFRGGEEAKLVAHGDVSVAVGPRAST